MWKYQDSDEYIDRRPDFEEKNSDALEYVVEKLDVLRKALEMGGKLSQMKFGFLHPEKGGVYAVASSGKGKRVTRLYVFPDEATKTLHRLTIGDKRTQRNDVDNCAVSASIIKSKHGKKPDI